MTLTKKFEEALEHSAVLLKTGHLMILGSDEEAMAEAARLYIQILLQKQAKKECFEINIEELEEKCRPEYSNPEEELQKIFDQHQNSAIIISNPHAANYVFQAMTPYLKRRSGLVFVLTGPLGTKCRDQAVRDRIRVLVMDQPQKIVTLQPE